MNILNEGVIVMGWKYCDNKGNVNKCNILSKVWWTPDIDKIEIQLNSDAVKKMGKQFIVSFNNNKPFAFFLIKNIRATWKPIESVHGQELYISEYSDDILCNFDINKINDLQTDCVVSYYSWNSIPQQLKDFIENKQPSLTIYKYYCHSCNKNFYDVDMKSDCVLCHASTINIVTKYGVVV